MKYAIRSLKYFLWFNILAGAIVAVMVLAGGTAYDGSLSSVFRDGIKRLIEIEIFFFVCSMLYPEWSFINLKDCPSGKNDAKVNAEVVKGYMAEHKFVLVKEEGSTLIYRYDGLAGRLSRMFEDEIKFFVGDDYVTVSGLRKDVVRIASYLEFKLR